MNAGIYILEPEVLRHIPANGPSDFGRDVFLALLAAGQALYGYRLSPGERFWWSDTLEDLQRTEREIASRDRHLSGGKRIG
ncbi:MAG: hypothetical protein ABIL11_07210 [Chloroflexota bacterium]